MLKRVKQVVTLCLLLTIRSYCLAPCLLETPVQSQCINSVDVETFDEENSCYMCIIASQMGLNEKAEQFCKKSDSYSPVCGYKQLQTLIKNGKLVQAVQREYKLFFVDPFGHSKFINQTLKKVQDTLQTQLKTIPQTNHYQKAIAYLYSNQTDLSLKSLITLSTTPNHTQTTHQHFLRVRVMDMLSQYSQALQYITRALYYSKPPHPYLYHLKANQLMHHIQFAQALEDFKQANQLFKKEFASTHGFSFTNYNIGLCYQKLGNQKAAIEAFEKAVIDSNSAEALNALGYAHYQIAYHQSRQPNLKKADQYYRKSLAVDQNYSICLYNYGMLCLLIGKNKQAKNLFQKCLTTTNPLRSCEFGLIKTYYLMHEKKQAEKIMKNLDREEQTLSDLASLLYEMHDYQEAIARTTMDREPRLGSLAEMRGLNQYALGYIKQAKKSYQRAIYLGSKTAEIYFNLGLCNQQLRYYAQAIPHYKNSYKLKNRKQTLQRIKQCEAMQQANTSQL